MATPSPSPPVQIAAISSPLQAPEISSTPAIVSDISSTPSVKSETPPPPPLDAKPVGVAPVTSRSPETPNPPPPHVITVPSCSAWFSWDGIHETERKILPEFFDGKSASRNIEVYKYFRDSIVRRFRVNPSRKITFTEARRGLAGDVGSVRRVFDFLEAWGLINYVPPAKPSSKDKREAVETLDKKESPKKLCSSCKSVLSLACFMTDKSDIVLCARCYVRGNYRPGLSTSDFQRVDISEEARTDWTDKETLHLLEAILHYGDEWKKVAQHVGSRTEKECVARFIKLPFGEQFMGSLEAREDGMQHQNDQADVRSSGENVEEANLLKRRRLTPLADASNPIMAQVAFLSAMVGPEVAGAAAQSAVAALDGINMASIGSPKGMEIDHGWQKGETFPANVSPPEILKEAAAEAEAQLKQEQCEVEQFITDIAQVQMKQIQEEIEHFEEVELWMEKEWLQLRHMKDLFFADQLALLQYKARTASPETGDGELKANDVT